MKLKKKVKRRMTLSDLNPKNFKTTSIQDENLRVLRSRMNLIEAAWGQSMKVTSGLRDEADHKRIYMALAKQRGLTTIKIPMGSKHLSGQACDVSDPDGSLFDWCKKNEHALAVAGLWCEEKDDQPRVHFQTVPPKSNKRFFKA